MNGSVTARRRLFTCALLTAGALGLAGCGSGGGGSGVTPSPSPTPPPPASGTFWVYTNGSFNWGGDFTYTAVADYRDASTASLSGGPYVIKVTLQGQWGGFQPYAPNFVFDPRPYSKITFALKPTIAGQQWDIYFVKTGDVDVGVHLDVTRYGPTPVAGQWGVYTVPLADLGAADISVYKFGIQDKTGLASNFWYVDAIGFVP